jgi:serine/threonine protein kinase
MPISINDFWKLTVASGLLLADECRQLQAQFSGITGTATQANTATLAQWLVAGGVLTRYQASVLAAGRPGPFVFGDFVILERIERGRLARCFKAQYKGTQPATLVFASASADSPEQARATIERLEAARAIKSPHVARVYQYHATARPPFFVLEPLDGESLRDRVAAGRLSINEACRVGFEAALGLVALHEHRSVQGNMTTDNIWIERSSTVKLLHFPLVAPLQGDARLDARVVDYLAPELNEPDRAANVLSDIYGLGCMLYELISGRVPFPGGSVAQKRARHASEVPARLDQLVPGVTEELADLVAEMLNKEEMLRAATASYVAHLLSPFTTKVAERRTALPPRTDPQKIAHGYGAWREPGWQAPPKPVEPAKQSRRPQAARTPDGERARSDPPTEASNSAEVTNHPVIVVTETPVAATPTLRRKRSESTMRMVAAATSLAVILLLASAYFVWGPGTAGDNAGVGQKAEVSVKEAAMTADSHDATAAVARRARTDTAAIDDDGQTMWASPTAGAPLDVRYLPSSAQMILALRPAELLASAEGQRSLAALGPEAEAARNRLQAVIGVDLVDVEQLLIASAPGESAAAQTSYFVRLSKPVEEASLLAAWGSPSATEQQDQKYFVAKEWAYYLPADGMGRTFVVAREPALQEILKRDGPPLLRQSLEGLLQTSDAARHISLLVASSFPFTDGRSMLPDVMLPLRRHWERLFGLQTQAVLASAHLGDELFLELRVAGPADVRAGQLADRLRQQFEESGEQVEQYVASLTPQAYGRLVINRFPRMWQLAGNFTRAAAEDRQAVLRCYLPATAAHNLALGAQLVLHEDSSAIAMPGVATGEVSAAAPASAEAALDRVTTLAFPRDTLERSLELLSREIGVPIVIEGADLQLEGITKNQSFELDQRDKPARAILGLILRLASADDKLVYVVRADRDGSESIHITTRTAAARRGEPLGADFDEKSLPKAR